MGREDEIRLIAYGIWEQEGCHDGSDWEHWLRAEAFWEDLNQQAAAKSVTKQPVKQSSRNRAAKKKSKKT